LKNIEDNPLFAIYFTKQWQDSFFISLHNFLSIVYQVSKYTFDVSFLYTSFYVCKEKQLFKFINLLNNALNILFNTVGNIKLNILLIY